MALADESRIRPQPIEKEMKTSYLDYAMSVRSRMSATG
jgi:DNA gyrase/topoisomerase IV subunit A